MTVKEHLWFFTTLKGVEDETKISTEVDEMIKSLALEDKRNTQSRNLSGGMKRKLSVGNALVGNSKVIFKLHVREKYFYCWIVTLFNVIYMVVKVDFFHFS